MAKSQGGTQGHLLDTFLQVKDNKFHFDVWTLIEMFPLQNTFLCAFYKTRSLNFGHSCS